MHAYDYFAPCKCLASRVWTNYNIFYGHKHFDVTIGINKYSSTRKLCVSSHHTFVHMVKYFALQQGIFCHVTKSESIGMIIFDDVAWNML
jgi:hypothetical protein